jgi:hypothetical protein
MALRRTEAELQEAGGQDGARAAADDPLLLLSL